MIIIGIDPGLQGAVAWIVDGVASVFDTPTAEVKKGKKKKTIYLPSEMAGLLVWAKGRECHVFIEDVHSMPKQGVASSFNFGKGCGIWYGILAAFQLPYTEVTPQAWKGMLMKGMADKNAAIPRAEQLYPDVELVTARGRKLDGRADALLIAEYGRRTLEVK